jgi:iron complex outermembrane receptor protein
MRLKTLVLCTTSLGVLAFAATPALAQDAQPAAPAAGAPQSTAPATETPQTDATDAGPDIVVTGLRESLASAQSLKRRAPQIVDAIVAEDIGKLPDLNTAQSAARIPGVQVYRQGGEAQNVLVRGLPFFTTTYNGREIFTAETRVVALQDFPSSNIAALEVYKTATADLVSPGLAGIVNVRSRRPFDFKNAQFSGSVWGLYTRQGGKAKPNFNVLATKSWDVGEGEFGILIQAAYQDMRYLDAEISNTDFVADPVVNGQRIRLPDIQRLFYRSGNRGRPAGNVQLQWRVNPTIEFYAEGLYQGFRNEIDDRLLESPLYGGASYTNLQFRNGTNLVRGGTVTNPGGNLFSFQGGTKNQTDTFQFAAGTHITSGDFKLNIDVARTLSTFRGNTESVDRVFTGARTVTFDLDEPQFTITGPNFTTPSGQNFQGLYEENQRSAGRDWQARADAQYDFANSVLRNVQVGARFQSRNARRNFDNRYAFLLGSNISASSLPLTFEVFRGVDFQPTNTFTTPTYDSIQDNAVALRQFVAARCIASGAVGTPGGRDCASYINTNGALLAAAPIYFAKERRLEGYGQVAFGWGESVNGLIGLRVQNARLDIPNAPAGAGRTANISRENTDWLPSASLTFRMTPELQLRLAASKTVTRPEFSQLGPVVFGAPPGGGTVGTQSAPYTAGGGNPFLQPFTSWNYDASLEYYFSRTGFMSAAYFHRTLDKFIQNTTATFIDPTLGVVRVTGPINTGKGRIDGFEVQGQTFFDVFGLPSWAKAFGIQVNVTYIDAKVQDYNGTPGGLSFYPITDQLNGVSKWNYNVTAMFESGPVSARLSYNGRSSFAATRQFRGDDLYTETARPADRLDLSAQFRLMDAATIFFDWTNITRTPFRQDLSSARAGAPRADFVRYLRYDESTVSVGLRFKFGK